MYNAAEYVADPCEPEQIDRGPRGDEEEELWTVMFFFNLRRMRRWQFKPMVQTSGTTYLWGSRAWSSSTTLSTCSGTSQMHTWHRRPSNQRRSETWLCRGLLSPAGIATVRRPYVNDATVSSLAVLFRFPRHSHPPIDSTAAPTCRIFMLPCLVKWNTKKIKNLTTCWRIDTGKTVGVTETETSSSS